MREGGRKEGWSEPGREAVRELGGQVLLEKGEWSNHLRPPLRATWHCVCLLLLPSAAMASCPATHGFNNLRWLQDLQNENLLS